MRITTQMLNKKAIKAGMPINRNSLLNYINSSSTENTLLSALNNKKITAANKEKKSNYEKLDKAADQLLNKIGLFIEKKEDSLFEKAKESGEKNEIYSNAEEMVETYNETVKILQSSSDFLSKYYEKMLKQNTSEYSKELSEIGITVEKSGTLKFDKEKIKETDIESLEKVLGSEGTFLTRTKFLAEKISNHAESNAKAASSQYNSSGILGTDFTSRYDFWG